MDLSPWYRTGRWTAWINAFALIAGAALFAPWLGAMESAQEGLAPAAASAVRLTHTYDALGRVFGFQLLFLAAWWAFVPISMALQKRLGDSLASHLLPRAIFAAAVLGSVTQFLDLAITAAARALVPALSAEALPTVALTYIPLREGAAWCSSGAFFLLGVGYLLAAYRAVSAEKMSGPWAYLSLFVGVLAILSLVSSVAAVPALNRISLIGVIFGSALWSVWTGRLLGKWQAERSGAGKTVLTAGT